MNLWNIPGIPHKGWECLEVVDLGPQTRRERVDRAKCEMCGNEDIRYVHILKHPTIARHYSVGCVCAEKMTDDYINPRRRENRIKNRQLWLSKHWKISQRGNHYLNILGFNIGVYQCGKKWGMWIHDHRYQKLFDSEVSAKMALFDEFEDFKLNEEEGTFRSEFFDGK